MTDTLPKSVREQAERAEAFHAEVEASENGNPGEGAPAVEEGTSEQATPEPVDPETAKHLPSEDDPRYNDPGYLRQRLSVLIGKYNTEVRDVIPGLRAQVETLQQENEQLKAAPAQESEQPEVSTNDALEKLREEFGGDVADQIAVLVRGETQPLRDKQQQAEQASEREQTEEAKRRFYRELAEAVPDYNAIDYSEAFKEWLQGTDPTTGRRRQELLGEAGRAFDASRVAALMTEFKQESAQGEGGGPDPERDVMPQERSTGSPAPSHQGRIWTSESIKDFYRNKARYTPEQAEALEADIHAAHSEGRIQR